MPLQPSAEQLPPQVDLAQVIIGAVCLLLALFILYMVHKFVHAAGSDWVMALEKIVITTLVAAFIIGHLLEIFYRMTHPGAPEPHSLTVNDAFLLLGSFAASMTIYFLARYLQKKLS